MNEMTRISAANASEFGARFTTAEFLRMIEADAFEDWKVELIEGELQRMPPPGNDHSRRVVDVVAGLLGVAPKPLVRAETGIDLGNDTVVGCDAALLREAIVGRGMMRPENIVLAVEIAETTRDRDLGMKRRKYAAAGIPNYWVVDADRSAVHIHAEPLNGDYAEIHTIRFGEPLPVPGGDATIMLD